VLAAETINEDPPLAVVLQLAEHQIGMQYFFSTAFGVETYDNASTGVVETNVMVAASASGVTVAHGIQHWFDHYGRGHSVSVLKRQLDYNALIGVTPSQWNPPTSDSREWNPPISDSRACAHVPYYPCPVRVTGIMDSQTLSISWYMLTRRAYLSWKIYNADIDARWRHSPWKDGQDIPAELRPWHDLLVRANDAIDGYRVAIEDLPLQATADNHYSGQFSVDFDADDKNPLVERLKQAPEWRRYFEHHEKLYGIVGLEIPNDETAKPPPTFGYSLESAEYSKYRDYLARIAWIEQRRAEHKPVPHGYGWPRPDEDYVRYYLDPAHVSQDALAHVDALYRRAEEALSAAEAYKNQVRP
jgi:hypothetical protein